MQSTENPMFFNKVLYQACILGDRKTARHVILDGADPNTVLLRACEKNKYGIVGSLCKLGATNLNDALYSASSSGFTTIVMILVKNGATNLNQALFNASFEGHAETSKILIALGANPNEALVNFAHEENFEFVKILVSLGATNVADALFIARTTGNEAIINFLAKCVALK